MSMPKILAAAVIAAATASLAFAQGTPPKPAANPAVGAGQRSTQNTPMGTTGTPGGGGTAAAQGTTAGSSAAMSAGGTGTTMNSSSGTTMSGGSMASGTHMTHKARKHKRAKADRN